MRNTIKGLLVASAMLPAVVLAEASNYNYVEARYLNGDRFGFDVNGWGMEGSVRIDERWFLTAGFSDLNNDARRREFRYSEDSQQLGLGFIMGENETASVYASVAYSKLRTGGRLTDFPEVGDVQRESDRLNGYDLGLGVRINLVPDTELHVAVNYIDYGSGNDVTIPSVGLIYNFTDEWAGFVDYQYKSDRDMIGLGIRFYYPY